MLKVGDTYYGEPVTDLIDGRERPATPTLRLRGGYDSALLILNAEPERNADGGYATDPVSYTHLQTLIIVDIPYVEAEGNGYSYTTVPLGIIMVDDVIITVSTRESTIITDFTEERIRGFWTFKRTRFILQLLHRNASRFLAYLKQIDKASMFVPVSYTHLMLSAISSNRFKNRVCIPRPR